MYKLLSFFMLLFFSLAIMPEQSGAYTVQHLEPEKFKEAFDAAFFVGKVEVVGVDKNPALSPEDKAELERIDLGYKLTPSFVTLRPVQSYKKLYDKDFIVYMVRGNWLELGKIYELMIFSSEIQRPSLYASPWHFKGKYHLAEFVIPDAAWTEYRKKALPSPRLRKMERECSKNRGKFFTEQRTTYCHLPTSDAGKVCLDNNECERFCFAVVSKEESYTIQSHLSDEHYESIKRQGKCGKWKNQEGWFNFVEKGVVTPLRTIGDGNYK